MEQVTARVFFNGHEEDSHYGQSWIAVVNEERRLLQDEVTRFKGTVHAIRVTPEKMVVDYSCEGGWMGGYTDDGLPDGGDWFEAFSHGILEVVRV